MKKATDPKKKGGKADLPPPEPEPELVEEEVEEVNPIDLMKTLRDELRLKEVQGTPKNITSELCNTSRLFLLGRLPYKSFCYQTLQDRV